MKTAAGKAAGGEAAGGAREALKTVRGEEARGEEARGEAARGEEARGDAARGKAARGEKARGELLLVTFIQAQVKARSFSTSTLTSPLQDACVLTGIGRPRSTARGSGCFGRGGRVKAQRGAHSERRSALRLQVRDKL